MPRIVAISFHACPGSEPRLSRPGRAQVQANLAAVQQGPLPAAVVAAWERAWRIARPDCPPYFR